MIWYISSSKKRGDYIKKLISWKLLENKKIIINKINEECNYVKGKFLEYKEDKFINKIDFINNVYIRECNEYKFIIDFNKLEQIIILKENDLHFFSKIEGNINIENNIICLKYNNSDGFKEIIIHLL